MSELIRENCGVGLVWDSRDAIEAVRKGLCHRGPDAEGYGAISDGKINVVRSYSGLLDEQAIRTILHYEPGHPMVAHTRYKTKGSSTDEELLKAAHPHVIGGTDIFLPNHYRTLGATEALVHNGTVTYDFSPFGFKTKTDCDTETLLMLQHLKGAEYVMENVPASYAIISIKAGEDFATVYRDRYGRRPLWYGLDKDGNFIVMSEDRAIEEIGGKPIREIRPGEMLKVYKNHVESKQVVPPQPRPCFFEANYLAKRLSTLWQVLRNQNINVAKLREDLGEELFKEHPPIEGVDFIAHVPRSPIDAARSYSEASKLPRKELFYKINETRTFMQPGSAQRNRAADNTIFVNEELTPTKDGIYFAVIDDSIVRATNAPKIKRIAEERGFRMRQLNVYTPIIGGAENGMDLGCVHGIDMPPEDNFIASRVGRDAHKIADYLGIDYVGFLSIDGLMNVFERHGIKRGSVCNECISSKGAEMPKTTSNLAARI